MRRIVRPNPLVEVECVICSQKRTMLKSDTYPIFRCSFKCDYFYDLMTFPDKYGKPSNNFYRKPEWRALRHKVLKTYGSRCMCCKSFFPKRKLEVDHIRPRYRFPLLSLDFNNLQVLCKPCHKDKTQSWRIIDYRSPEALQKALKINRGPVYTPPIKQDQLK